MAGMVGSLGNQSFTGQMRASATPAAGGKTGGAFGPVALGGGPSGPKPAPQGLLPTKEGFSWSDDANRAHGESDVGGGDKIASAEKAAGAAPNLSKSQRKKANKKTRSEKEGAVGLRTDPVPVGPKTAAKPTGKSALTLEQRLKSVKQTQSLAMLKGKNLVEAAKFDYELKLASASDELRESLRREKEAYDKKIQKCHEHHERRKAAAADALAKAKKRQEEEDKKLAAILQTLEDEDDAEGGDDAASITSTRSMEQDPTDADVLADRINGASLNPSEQMEDVEKSNEGP